MDETKALGEAIRTARLRCADQHPRAFSVRALAARLGVSATYLSLAGRVPADVTEALRARPALADLVRAFRDVPEQELTRTIRRIRDGEW